MNLIVSFSVTHLLACIHHYHYIPVENISQIVQTMIYFHRIDAKTLITEMEFIFIKRNQAIDYRDQFSISTIQLGEKVSNTNTKPIIKMRNFGSFLK